MLASLAVKDYKVCCDYLKEGLTYVDQPDRNSFKPIAVIQANFDVLTLEDQLSCCTCLRKAKEHAMQAFRHQGM